MLKLHRRACVPMQEGATCQSAASPHTHKHSPPLKGPGDTLAALCWSPPGRRRLLLTATTSGALLAWGQQLPDGADGAGSAVTVDRWWPSSLPGIKGGLLAAAWLAPAAAWAWDAAHVAGADYDASPAPAAASLFVQHPPSGGREGVFDWLQRPGMLAVAAAGRDGQVHVMWAVLGAEGRLAWRLAPPVVLPGAAPDAVVAGDGAAPTAPLLEAADMASDGANGLLVAYALAGMQPGAAALRVARIEGSWPFAAAAGQALPVTQLAQLEAEGPVSALSWDPSSHARRLAVLTHATPMASIAGGCRIGLHFFEASGSVAGSAAQQTLKAPEGQQQGQPQPWGLVWAADGSWVAAASAGRTHCLDPLTLQPLVAPLHSPALPSPASGSGAAAAVPAAAGAAPSPGSSPSWRPAGLVASSPNSVALACCTGGRLLVWALPLRPAPQSPSNLVAARLAWVLVAGADGWDVLQVRAQGRLACGRM